MRLCSMTSVARFTGFNSFSSMVPSTKVLGYFQIVRYADELLTRTSS